VLHILCRDLTTLSGHAQKARKARIERGQAEDEFAFAAKAKAQPGGGVATQTGKAEGRVMNEELGKRPGTSDESKPVAPGRTTFPADLVKSALADMATSCRHPETLAKPLPGMPHSVLSKALKAAREKAATGQPALTVVPEWDEMDLVVQPAMSACKK
jgi:hypothetical protein